MEVQVLLMANSYKYRKRCLAGLRTDSWTWFRPVSNTPDGGIPTPECDVIGGVLRPLDLISCEVTAAKPLSHQVENWLMRPGSIRLLSQLPFDKAEERIFASSQLSPYFLDTSNPRILPSFFDQISPPKESLALIRVQSAIVDVDRRIRFKHHNQDWNLKLTDEHFVVDSEKGTTGPAYLCVSVGNYFPEQDAHFKMVAGIIPIPQKEAKPIQVGQIGTVGQLCGALFGSQPLLSVPRFATNDWFYQGCVPAECQSCGEQSLHSLRKHYLMKGHVAHYWAIVCDTCETVKELADFGPEFGKAFKIAANKEAVPDAHCATCVPSDLNPASLF